MPVAGRGRRPATCLDRMQNYFAAIFSTMASAASRVSAARRGKARASASRMASRGTNASRAKTTARTWRVDLVEMSPTSSSVVVVTMLPRECWSVEHACGGPRSSARHMPGSDAELLRRDLLDDGERRLAGLGVELGRAGLLGEIGRAHV